MSEVAIDLLHQITVNIKKNLNADYAFIGAVDTEKMTVKTESFCSDNIEENVEYDLDHTPSKLVLNGETSLFTENVRDLFPQDQLLIDYDISGYIGVPLFSLDRKQVIGIFGVLFKTDIIDPEKCLTSLELIAPRVELELDRILLTQLLEDKKALFDAISNQTTEGITVADMEGNYLYVNQAFCKMSGYSEKELLKMTVFDMKAENQNHQSFFDSKEDYEGVAMRVNLQKKDGTEYLTEIIGDVIIVNGKQQVLGTIRDISDRVEVEQKILELNKTLEKKVKERTAELEESLNIKQILLKEITHRVKNNLQVIASILNLQNGLVESEEARKVCTETSSRIHSMALIHEALYKENEYSHVQFQKYAAALIEYLLDIYDVSSITINQKIEDCSLSLDSATSCGMIIIELVTNSIKYAFPENQDGTIDISLSSPENGTYKLEVKDSGIGFPKDYDIINSPTLGTQLIVSLVEQIDGSYEMNGDNGTSFTMTFRD